MASAGDDTGFEVGVAAAFGLTFAAPGRALARIIPASSGEQEILREQIAVEGAPWRIELVGDDRVVVVQSDAPVAVSVSYSGAVRVHRSTVPPRIVPDAHLTPLMLGRWLLPSRYCPSDRLGPTAEALFPDRADPQLLERCRRWVEQNVAYVCGSSNAMTAADETLLGRQGICRDFAHLTIALLRGLGVPARFVAAYGPGVDPPDFHAVAEAHDGECWQMLDATGMTIPGELVVIARGRDAGDVPWVDVQGGPADVFPPRVSVATGLAAVAS